MWRTGNCTESSNLSLSATTRKDGWEPSARGVVSREAEIRRRAPQFPPSTADGASVVRRREELAPSERLTESLPLRRALMSPSVENKFLLYTARNSVIYCIRTGYKYNCVQISRSAKLRQKKCSTT